MGLKPKSELLHKYFLSSQVALLLLLGVKSYHSRFHQELVEEEVAENETAQLPVLEYLLSQFNSGVNYFVGSRSGSNDKE